VHYDRKICAPSTETAHSAEEKTATIREQIYKHKRGTVRTAIITGTVLLFKHHFYGALPKSYGTKVPEKHTRLLFIQLNILPHRDKYMFKICSYKGTILTAIIYRIFFDIIYVISHFLARFLRA
jgi:hypothetical protein